MYRKRLTLNTNRVDELILLIACIHTHRYERAVAAILRLKVRNSWSNKAFCPVNLLPCDEAHMHRRLAISCQRSLSLLYIIAFSQTKSYYF